ncbi:hypothetical protein [Breznakia pachnodae]|uniref:DNA-directed RNA polymerase subunit RPC12/RpoP n=1 Tax=Breznakia pachnodae TaxID=265178 RepID=A0ABU0E4X5_9FIRM|nr:hypothetical protein [Breznakia pachnodae]MDQ0361949.1 DNA-directed RNA polymerase subunit RPC12/RpoP [Breznakia pachnodae]
MGKIKNALYRFLQGRYGNDQLNKFIYVILFAVLLLNLFVVKSSYMTIATYLLLAILLFRTYSRNIYKRRMENTKFLNLTKPIRRRFSILSKNRKDKANKYYLCPSCSQTVRVPRGKGKIEIKCPKCQTKFTKST